jgi:hypothetical protein
VASLLRAGHTDYVINEAALDYMRGRVLTGAIIPQLAAHQQTRFADQAAWQTHLDRLDIRTVQITLDPICIATEGALWGSVQVHGLLRDMMIVSDDAGQFDIGQHALCWVLRNGSCTGWTFTDLHRIAQQRMRALIWRFYDDLKAHRAAPTAPALSPSIACWCGCTPTSQICSGCSIARRYRSTPAAPSATFVSMSPSARSVVALAVPMDATHSSVWCAPPPNSAPLSGIILATASAFQGS